MKRAEPDKAVKYAPNMADVGSNENHGYVNVTINPITRLEKSRNRDPGNTGVSSTKVGVYETTGSQEGTTKSETNESVYEHLKPSKKAKTLFNGRLRNLIFAGCVIFLASVTVSIILSYVMVREMRVQGPPGPKGDTGIQGPPGPVGATGTAGRIGATGSTGATGRPGNTGPTGIPGATGRLVPRWPRGLPGTMEIAEPSRRVIF